MNNVFGCSFSSFVFLGLDTIFGYRYDYGVPPGRDLIAQFAESCAGVGVKLGLYYSLTANSYLNYPSLKDPAPRQARITQEQYNDIVTQHLTELWTNYGELTEICALVVPFLGLALETEPKPLLYSVETNWMNVQGLMEDSTFLV